MLEIYLAGQGYDTLALLETGIYVCGGLFQLSILVLTKAAYAGIIGNNAAHVAAVLKPAVRFRVAHACNIQGEACVSEHRHAYFGVIAGKPFDMDNFAFVVIAVDAVFHVANVVGIVIRIVRNRTGPAKGETVYIHRDRAIDRHNIGVTFQQGVGYRRYPHIKRAKGQIGLHVQKVRQAAILFVYVDAIPQPHTLQV